MTVILQKLGHQLKGQSVGDSDSLLYTESAKIKVQSRHHFLLDCFSYKQGRIEIELYIEPASD